MATKIVTSGKWETIPFLSCLQKVSVGRDKQIKQKEYMQSGLFPVIDQGQSFIAGYTNDKNKVISDIQPFIIFGDHTRILKYIDFPIALGADGTKVIKPKDNFDTKFFYFFLKNLDIPNRGYNRHFTILKEKNILQPSLPEQKSIAHVLTVIQDAIAGQEELIAKLKELKKSMMQHLFTHGTKGEKTKMTEIGEMPEGWNVVELGDVCNRKNEQSLPNQAGSRIYVGLEHLEPGEANVGKYGLESEVKSSKVIFNSGDTLYGKLRPYLDKAAIPNFDGLASTDIIVLNGESISNKFLVALLHTEDFLKYAKQTTSGVNHPRTSWESIRKYKFALPDKKQQESMQEAYWAIIEKIEAAQEKLSNYQNLFKTLLHELMSGERRINKI